MQRDSSSAVASISLDDGELAARVARNDHIAFEALMRRHNSRLFRIARAILKDDTDAEDALQDAYLDAYRHIADFRGGAQLTTWLTRIVINQALMRLRGASATGSSFRCASGSPARRAPREIIRRRR